MKILIKFLACCVILVCVGFVSILTAQITDDPFEGEYSLAKSAEAFLMESVFNSGEYLQNFDFNRRDLSINPGSKIKFSGSTGDIQWPCLDAVAVDLNGDSKDEIVFLLYQGLQKAGVAICEVNNLALVAKSTFGPFACVTDKEMATTRLIRGNFVDDAKEEFALTYIGTDAKFHVQIYEASSSNMQPVKLAESTAINVTGKEMDNWEYDYTGDHFDIAAVDYDHDQTDEIVMVHKLDFARSNREFYFQAISFDYTTNNTTLSTTTSNLGPVILDYGTAKDYYTHGISRISRPSLARGDLDGNGQSEIAFGYIVSTRRDYFPAMAYKSELFTMQILGIDATGNVSFFNGPNLTLVGSYTHGQHAQNWNRHHFSLTIECGDFDNDGRDEVVCNGPDSLYVLSCNSTNKIEKKYGMPCNNHTFYAHRNRSLAVADVNVDTAAALWSKDIVYMRYSPRPQDSWGQSMGYVSLGVASIENGHLRQKDTLMIQPASFAKDNQLRYTLALGDFDGDGLRLGPPELVATIPEVREPRVIINAPPVHFDIFDQVPYDLGSAFDGSSEFVSSYTHTEGATNQLLIKNVADWDYSVGGGYEGSIVAGGNAAFIHRHGQYFEESDFNAESMVEITSITSSIYDWYYTTITDYYLFEYPLLYDNGQIGHLLVQYPEFKEDEWIHSKSQEARYIIPNHESGNILSYVKLDDMKDSDSLSIEGTKYTLSDEYPAEGGYWQLDLTNTSKTSFLKKIYNNNSWELKVRLGGMADFFGFKFGGNLLFNAAGRYDTQNIISSAITAGTGTNIQVNFGKLDKQTFGEVDYKIKPYVYYSKDGAFVLDYIAEPIRGGTWWEEHYADQPDLTFILPWRYDTEKGYPGITESKRTETKDLIFIPRYPELGDTVCIVTRIHNYSLKDLNENVSIQYFLGDPDNGGELLNVLYEGFAASEIVLAAALPAREEMAFKVDWLVPAVMDDQPRIYAVIDPNNKIAEIHENNNKGNALLEIQGGNAIDENSTTIPLKYSLEQNYPNPFNPSTRIRFNIARAEKVKIEIYNMLGQKVETLLDERLVAGVHQIEFAPKKFASGMYFYQITAGDFVSAKKMIMLK